MKPQEPPYKVRIIDPETDQPGEELRLHGRVMGKLRIKHVRLYHTATETEYIRWNAPDSLRLYIADKPADETVLIYTKQDERDEYLWDKKTETKIKTGEKVKYMFITKHAIIKDRELKELISL